MDCKVGWMAGAFQNSHSPRRHSGPKGGDSLLKNLAMYSANRVRLLCTILLSLINCWQPWRRNRSQIKNLSQWGNKPRFCDLFFSSFFLFFFFFFGGGEEGERKSNSMLPFPATNLLHYLFQSLRIIKTPIQNVQKVAIHRYDGAHHRDDILQGSWEAFEKWGCTDTDTHTVSTHEFHHSPTNRMLFLHPLQPLDCVHDRMGERKRTKNGPFVPLVIDFRVLIDLPGLQKRPGPRRRAASPGR